MHVCMYLRGSTRTFPDSTLKPWGDSIQMISMGLTSSVHGKRAAHCKISHTNTHTSAKTCTNKSREIIRKEEKEEPDIGH